MTTTDLPQPDRLLNIIRSFSQRSVLVVGDAVADQFVHGVISRVSREAPVFILRHEHTETIPGGAANCAINLASLGARVSLVTALGDDEVGRSLVKSLKTGGVNCDGVILSDRIQTVKKMRVLAGQLHSTRQQVIRIDYDGDRLADAAQHTAVITASREAVATNDAVIISDYNYGVASLEVANTIREITEKRSTPVFVDSRTRLRDFAGSTSATPNEEEVDQLLGQTSVNSDQLAASAERLREELRFQSLLVTRGSHGMLLLQPDVAPVKIEAIGASEPVDVTGAGDTVIATYALAVTSGGSFTEAAVLANHAGGLVVMKRGTASVTPAELVESVSHN